MTNDESLISIIIPVYNVEPFLKQCLDSILGCRLEDGEILLSMGKSSDDSNRICEEYMHRYGNIRCLFQKGKGLSDARNSALELAKGKYILFIDSDDFVDTPCLNGLIEKLRNGTCEADVVVTDFYRLDCRTNKKTEVFQIGTECPVRMGMESFPEMLKQRKCFWNVWRYIYRRGFLMEHDIWFPENMLSEDIAFTTDVLLAGPKLILSHSPYYIYRVGRGDSLMDRPTIQRLSDTITILKGSIHKLRNAHLACAGKIIAQYQFEYLLNLALTVEIKKEDCANAKMLYQDWKSILRDSEDPVVRFGAMGIRVLGLTVMAYHLHFLKMLKRLYQHGSGKEQKHDYHKNTLSNQLCRRRK